VAVVPFQAFEDSSHGGIVETVRCAQSPMHLSAVPSGSSRLHYSMNFISRN